MVNGQSFILIRQRVALVRSALAEVCTVPVLLVIVVVVYAVKATFHYAIWSQNGSKQVEAGRRPAAS